ncbi:D-threonine aldolase, metal-activated pyridoxal enzyme [Pedobacter sp. BAL39]|uniref:D-TA family PLP-dependent enzyme n=1 Tax=Pedobacter sp. BAL39 TaxID=391596 RepID=UPI0001559321|nr:D-TA family PLP-dependent enzyme [Pedobacter sp. BAL39]EDM36048.1 D-threonine aldolase, metal-activated pyridoxal enzyme [Pedobacter sp. BAL39]
MEQNWQLIANVSSFDTPFLAVFPERIRENIGLALEMVQYDLSRFRPHIKTHKMAEVLRLFLDRGIAKIKCATIAEAELAAATGITDVLLAYQPVGAKVGRLLALIEKFPETHFSCLVDHLASAEHIGEQAIQCGKTLTVYIDLNTGMNRTGYPYRADLPDFYRAIAAIPGLVPVGLHIYDGHLQNTDALERVKPAKEALDFILKDVALIERQGWPSPIIVAGGSNTFSFYAAETTVECSPGTFVFWDINYAVSLPELPFKFAAVLAMTVISKPTADTICLDLGYKSVSSEQPLEKRMICYWNNDLSAVGHSEEHLVMKCKGPVRYEVGDLIYGIPFHVCPSVALYDQVYVVNDRHITGTWQVAARGKKVTV